jgi:hypothetical protein
MGQMAQRPLAASAPTCRGRHHHSLPLTEGPAQRVGLAGLAEAASDLQQRYDSTLKVLALIECCMRHAFGLLLSLFRRALGPEVFDLVRIETVDSFQVGGWAGCTGVCRCHEAGTSGPGQVATCAPGLKQRLVPALPVSCFLLTGLCGARRASRWTWSSCPV